MNLVQKVITEIFDIVPPDKRNDPAEVVGIARLKAEITCRQLGGVLGLTPSQISDIEHGRMDVPEDVILAIFMVCGSKLTAQKALQGWRANCGRRQ